VEFGIMFANVATFARAEGALALVRAAEEAGIESLWTVEHVVVPSGYESTYPYSSSGRMPGSEDSPIPDPFIWLAFVASASTSVKLGTGVAILPERSPVVTAKEVASLDQLSAGRVLLGVGAGWLKEEFDALGVPFERRGDRLDEYIGALRALWTQERATFEGEFVSFRDCILRPRPVRGTVPIHVGGHTERAARRAGRLGDGFFPVVKSPESLEALLVAMRAAAEDAGRDPAAIEVTATTGRDLDTVKRFAELGVHRCVIPPPTYDLEAIGPALAAFSEDVVARV
jgi:probable F420-dependent oxidoreductase